MTKPVRYTVLDVLRGWAALAVCAGHIRSFLFVDFWQVHDPTSATRCVYFVTGLGHQAVIVFFVLSGFLVGGSVLKRCMMGDWSLRDYALQRLARLWIVMIPALVLTSALDGLGRGSGMPGYSGDLAAFYNSGPRSDGPADLSLLTWLGNIAFLQTILVPCFGTNGPLWSLANEFWYYVLFPLLVSVMWHARGLVARDPFAGRGRTLVRWGFSALLAAGLIRWLPAGLLAAGAIWLLGVLGFFILQWSWLRGLLDRRISAAIAAVFLGFVLLASRLGWTVGSDGWVGTACLLVIVTWADVGPGPRWWARLTAGLSQISYTLYLVHFPLLAFGFFGWARGVRLQPGLEGYTLGVAVLALCLAFAVGFWWCFERNTDALRAAVLRHGPRWLSPAGKAQAG